MAKNKTLDKSSFQKLFREMYSVNPDKWNEILTKTGKTMFSKKGTTTRGNPRKIDRQTMGSKAFDKLMHIDYQKFQDFGKKQDAQVNRPKSIRVNNQTLGQLRMTNQRNTGAKNVEYVDSAAVNNFNVKDNHDGTKDVSIVFQGGDGKEYLYPDVPANVANGLYAAPSKGGFVQNVLSRYSDYNNPKVQQKIREGN